MSLNVLVSGKTQSMSCGHVQSVLRIERIISAAWSSRHTISLMDKGKWQWYGYMYMKVFVCNVCLNARGTPEGKSVRGDFQS